MHFKTTTPAKLNLSLLVGPRRADGYHELFTVFAPIDLVDELEFELRARPAGNARPGDRIGDPEDRGVSASHGAFGGDLVVDCLGVPGESNLVTRALCALERETGWAFDGQVTIQKGIPMGGGLGGGSSDAAAALKAGAAALLEAGGPSLDKPALRAIARPLGADVPLFLDPRCSFGRGIGEILEPLDLPVLDVVVVAPGDGLSTPRVYQAFDDMGPAEDLESFRRRAAGAEALWREVANESADGRLTQETAAARIAALLQNDLEKASFSLLPLIEETRRMLEALGPLGVLMTGSGSTVFALCRSAEKAETTGRHLAEKGLSARSARTGWPPRVS